MGDQPHRVLLDKLKHMTGDQMLRAGLEHVDLMKLITLVQDDLLPLDDAGHGGYRVTTPCLGQPERSIMGPGLTHEVPVFQSDHVAETMARCLGRAFRAGQRNRSAALNALLADTQRR